MPNWCSNVLKVRGSKLALARFKKKAASKPNGSGPLSFASFVPEPKNAKEFYSAILASDNGVTWHSPWDLFKELGIPVESSGNFGWGCDRLRELGWDVEVKDYTTDKDGNITVKKPDETTLYEFHTNHWGTKWDACYVELHESKGLVGIVNHQLTYTFDTVWSPPTPVVRAMQREFPTLKITLRYEESGMAYMGGIEQTVATSTPSTPTTPTKTTPTTTPCSRRTTRPSRPTWTEAK
jgi:hypothetical protein